MTACTAPTPWPAWSAPVAVLEAGSGAQATLAAIAWIEALGETQQWPPKTGFALTLCADEALTNIATYARQDSGAPAHISLSCGPVEGGWALCIADNGAPFDPTAQDSAALASSVEDAPIGGHGLRLMRHYLQALHYRRRQDRNELLLVVATPPV